MYETTPLPPTDKQLTYARAIARKLDVAIPRGSLETRQALSSWIDRHNTAQRDRHGGHLAAGGLCRKALSAQAPRDP
jgi:hypothetical protein